MASQSETQPGPSGYGRTLFLSFFLYFSHVADLVVPCRDGVAEVNEGIVSPLGSGATNLTLNPGVRQAYTQVPTRKNAMMRPKGSPKEAEASRPKKKPKIGTQKVSEGMATREVVAREMCESGNTSRGTSQGEGSMSA